MSVSFNVLDDPWIPVITAEATEELLGIRQVLFRAHELREISSASPLEEYSMYRFLGLFLMDALRPERESDIEDLLDAGRFDPAAVEDYIALCTREGVSFDLFDAERPFLQSPRNETLDGEEKVIDALDCMRPSGNNHTHFLHTSAKKHKLDPDRAMRLLLTTYLFSTAGAQGYPSSVYGAPPYFGIIMGENLYKTLINTLLPTEIIGISFDSPPVLWRRTEPILPKHEVGATSWLQSMLFPNRRIRLVPDEAGFVSGVYLSQGENYVNKEVWRDPYVTYRKNEMSVFPMRPSSERAVWRNFCDIADLRGGASQLLKLYLSIHDGDEVELHMYGVETNQASYLAVYRHSMRFPLCITKDDDRRELLKRAIAACEEMARAFGKALTSIKELGGAAAAESTQEFYRDCETRFWTLCDAVVLRGPDNELFCSFCDDIATAVQQCYITVVSKAHLRAHAMAAAAAGRDELMRRISKLKKEARM